MIEIIKPDSVAEQEKHEENALQLERRRIAKDVLCSLLRGNAKAFEKATPEEISVACVTGALMMADELITKTPVKK